MAKHYMQGRHPKFKKLRITRVQPLGLSGGGNVFLGAFRGGSAPKPSLGEQAKARTLNETRTGNDELQVDAVELPPCEPVYSAGIPSIDQAEGDPFAELFGLLEEL